jgi:hypothetical protein
MWHPGRVPEVKVTSRARLGALLIGLGFALFGAQAARADDPTLYVHYTMTCTFTLIGDNGAPITVIPPGRYQVLVTSPQPFAEPDLSGATDPNLACGGSLSFHLTGPGVSVGTTLDDGDSASDQLQATFQSGGSYTAFEDRRPTARLTFNVQTGAASTGGGGSVNTSPATPAKETKPDAGTGAVSGKVVGTLNGSVDTAGKLRLTLRGKTVSSLEAGRYKIVVLDETSKRGFSIQRLGKGPTSVTSTRFLGRHSVTLRLTAGRWFYFSPARARTPFIVHA